MRIANILGLSILLTAVSGFAQKVQLVVDHSAGFSNYQTYRFMPGRTLKGNQILESKALNSRIMGAMRRTLAAKGMREETNNADADLYITFSVGSKTRTSRNGSRRFSSRGAFGYPAQRTLNDALSKPKPNYQYERKGILVIEIVDAATNQPVWRATCTGRFDPYSKQENFYNVAQKAFKKYPFSSPVYEARAPKGFQQITKKF